MEDRYSRPDERMFDLDRDGVRPIILNDTDELRVERDISFEIFGCVWGKRWEKLIRFG